MTFRPKHRIRQIARFVLVFLFFTQAALAMSGCLMSAAGLAKVMAEVETSDCNESSGMNLNLCHAHCTADLQSVDTGELPPFSPLHTAVLVVPPIEYTAHPAFTFTVARVEHTGDPPKPIRFCSFQI
jgi:hypothetical protein